MILSKKDAEEFLDSNDEFIIKNDVDINMINGGNTSVKKVDADCWRIFSSGQNWHDQQTEDHDRQFIIDKIYRNRKNINYHYF